jgi:sigma-B regulation protein RsbU (phosphoserine phosphatase)
MSDGITEAADPAGAMLGEEGLERIIRKSAGLRGAAFLDAIFWDLEAFAAGDLVDDVSAVFFEFDGAKQNAD